MLASIVNEWWEVVSNPGHVLAEMTFIAIEAAILTPIVRWLIKRHDRIAHGKK